MLSRSLILLGLCAALGIAAPAFAEVAKPQKTSVVDTSDSTKKTTKKKVAKTEKGKKSAEPELTAAGEIAGTFRGIPPYGAGKIKNLEQWLQARGLSLSDFSRSTFYSDSQNDIPLLSLVTHPVATNPNTRLLDHAKAQGWPILNLFDD